MTVAAFAFAATVGVAEAQGKPWWEKVNDGTWQGGAGKKKQEQNRERPAPSKKQKEKQKGE